MPIISGTAKWAKLTKPGKPYTPGDTPAWSIDVYIDDDQLKAIQPLVKSGALRIKNKGEGNFVTFKRKTLKVDPVTHIRNIPADPIRVVNFDGSAFAGGLIGNGSKVDVKYLVNEGDDGKFRSNILAVRVVELEAYEGQGDDWSESAFGDATKTAEDWSAED